MWAKLFREILYKITPRNCFVLAARKQFFFSFFVEQILFDAWNIVCTGIFYQLDLFSSDQIHQILYVSLTRMLLFVASWQSHHLSVKKQKNQKNISSKWFLIRLMCAWIHLWSDHFYSEVTYDHTIPRLKWPLIIPSPDRSDLWSYHPQTEVTSDHTIPRPKWPLIKLF